MSNGPDALRKVDGGTVFIYALRCMSTGALRYIGKTKTSLRCRLAGHLADARAGSKSPRAQWLRAIGADASAVAIEPIHRVSDDWRIAERFFIASARSFGFDLVNATDGGDQFPTLDAETLARRNKSQDRARLDPLVIQRRAAAALRCCDARIAKSRASVATPENKARAAEHSRRLWAQPDMKRRKSESAKAAWSDPIRAAVRRANISEGKRIGWARKKLDRVRRVMEWDSL